MKKRKGTISSRTMSDLLLMPTFKTEQERHSFSNYKITEKVEKVKPRIKCNKKKIFEMLLKNDFIGKELWYNIHQNRLLIFL